MLLKISRKMTPHQSQKPLVNNLVLFPFALIESAGIRDNNYITSECIYKRKLRNKSGVQTLI